MDAESFYQQLLIDCDGLFPKGGPIASSEVAGTFESAGILSATDASKDLIEKETGLFEPNGSTTINRLLSHLLDEILKGVPPDTLKQVDGKILCREIPTGSPNGYVCKVPESDEYLILVDSALFSAGNDFSRVATLLGMIPQHSVSASRSSHLKARIELSLREYCKSGTYLSAGLKDEVQSAGTLAVLAASFIQHNILKAVIAHEVAHILNGDLDHSATSAVETTTGLAIEHVIQWSKEYAADAGIVFVLQSLPKANSPLIDSLSRAGALFGPVCLFLMLALMEEIVAEDDPNAGISSSHPPPPTRLANILGLYLKLFPNLFPEINRQVQGVFGPWPHLLPEESLVRGISIEIPRPPG